MKRIPYSESDEAAIRVAIEETKATNPTKKEFFTRLWEHPNIRSLNRTVGAFKAKLREFDGVPKIKRKKIKRATIRLPKKALLKMPKLVLEPKIAETAKVKFCPYCGKGINHLIV